MKKIRDLVFPTTIHYYDNVLEPKYIDSMVNYIEDKGKAKTTLSEGWQSPPNLHTHTEFQSLSEKIMYVSKEYLNELNYIFDDYKITDMWATMLPPFNYHGPHSHSNNILSGVFYLKSNESANIVFADPRPQAHVLQPKLSNYQINNSAFRAYPSIVNRLILFPSYLTHHVPVNKSNQNRISVAFNVMLKGKVGESISYQSAEF